MDPAVAARVEELRGEFAGLLDEEALTLLALDEMGLNAGAFVTIDALAGRTEASVRCTVERVEPPREFVREGRPPGRVANVVVSDATGEARVTFWDRDVEKAEELRAGQHVTLVNARVKDSRYGIELHVAPWTALEVEGAIGAARKKLLMDVQSEADPLAIALAPARVEDVGAPRQTTLDAPGPLVGLVRALSPTRPVRRSDGSTAFVAELDVEASEGIVRVVCWDEAVKSARGFAVGDPILIEGLVAKLRGAATEWHTTGESKLKAPRAPGPDG